MAGPSGADITYFVISHRGEKSPGGEVSLLLKTFPLGFFYFSQDYLGFIVNIRDKGG